MHRVGAIFARDMRLAFSYPMSLFLPFVSIAVSVVGFFYISKLVLPSAHLGVQGRSSSYFTYVIINLAFMLLQTSALGAFSESLRRDQTIGTLEPILASPTSPALLAVSFALWPLMMSTLQMIAYFAVAALFFGFDLRHIDIPALLMFLVLGVVCMSCLGIIGAGIVLRYKQSPPSSLLVGSAATLLTGVLFPVALLPLPLRIVSWLFPLTHSLTGMRGAILGVSLSHMKSDVLWLSVAIAVIAPFSLAFFAWALRSGQRDGTLAYY